MRKKEISIYTIQERQEDKSIGRRKMQLIYYSIANHEPIIGHGSNRHQMNMEPISPIHSKRQNLEHGSV